MNQVLDRLEQFDITKGLQCADGDHDLYLDVLKVFHDQLNQEFSNLAKQLQHAMDDDLARQIHTLKGSAASLGASRIEAAAREADTALRAGSPPSQATLEKLDDAIRDTTAELDLYLT